MRQVRRITLLTLILLIVLACSLSASEDKESKSSVPKFPIEGMVTVVDIGSEKCPPCKVMAATMRELAQEYAGRAALLFIDGWKNPEVEQEYGVNSLPTLIFYDKDGEEVSRHQGFLSKKSIVNMLERLGVRP